jgi:putative addiction module component (TIGR02574 family)
MKIEELINNAESLPVDIRVKLVESLLLSLNPKESKIDKSWANLAKKRSADIHTASAETISGEDVFSKVWNKFNK